MGFAKSQQQFLKGGSDPRVTIGTKRACGGQRAAHSGVAPALFMTRGLYFADRGSLWKSFFSPLVTDDNKRTVHRTATRTKRTMGMVR
jgi:hypothetical protein